MDNLMNCYIISCKKRAINWFVTKLYQMFFGFSTWVKKKK